MISKVCFSLTKQTKNEDDEESFSVKNQLELSRTINNVDADLKKVSKRKVY